MAPIKYPCGLNDDVLMEVDKDKEMIWHNSRDGFNVNRLVINKKDKCMDYYRNNERIYKDIERGITSQFCEDGTRWEGDWFNQQPFGYGNNYNGDGNRVYSGFMFEGKKVGFGTEYFADNHAVDYVGIFMNDLRHGWGTSYDRYGNKLYEGDWRFGKNDIEEIIDIQNDNDINMYTIHDLIKELKIGDNCFNYHSGKLVINYFGRLETLKIGNKCFGRITYVKISHCYKLKSIRIMKNNFNLCSDSKDNLKRDGSVEIAENPSLEEIIIGQFSFGDYTTEFKLQGLENLKTLEVGSDDNIEVAYGCFYWLDHLNLSSI